MLMPARFRQTGVLVLVLLLLPSAAVEPERPSGLTDVTQLSPFPCTPNMANHPLQILDDTTVASLDPTTGVYTTVWTLSKSNSDPPYTNLNAADISSRDSHAYGIFALEGKDHRFFARFDNTGVEFVAWFPASCNTNAAVFDRMGNLYVGCGSELYKIERPDLLPGYSSVSALLAAQQTNNVYSALFKSLNHGVSPARLQGISDLAALYYDFGGTGESKNWLLGLANHGVDAEEGTLVLINTDDLVSYELFTQWFRVWPWLWCILVVSRQ